MKTQLLKQIFNSQKAEEEIELKEPLKLSRSQVLELLQMFGKVQRSIITSRGDIWTELLFYDSGVKIVITYEIQDNKIGIHKIKMVRG
ncbi:unknown [Sulfolobus spindle-shaped virus 6]|uniref:Uncharacterized protein n=1 Tax=Sulfolobus spindle-shaped virus 6 TaxID=693627 RepID=D1GF38_9VIRU|nr:hypothetical protein SSSV6_gp20 [Sulfolobus spindle-shaped virus 6]ACZ35739.1 unknown [Sulfolobus spindle-shaped virus 6]